MENEAIRDRQIGTLDEVAAYLRVSRRTVLNYVGRGLLNPVYFGRLRRFRWSEVLKLERTGVPSEAITR